MSDHYTYKLGSMVRKLYHSTVTGSIKWDYASDNLEALQSIVGGRRVTISPVNYVDEDGDQMQDIEVAIYNDTGRKAESVRDSMLATVPLSIEGFSGWYSLMSATIEAAKRRIDGSEEAIDDVLKALDDEMPF